MDATTTRDLHDLLADVGAHLDRAAADRATDRHLWGKMVNQMQVQQMFLNTAKRLFNEALAREATAIAALEEAGEVETAKTLREARAVSIAEAGAQMAPDPRQVN